jgi:two-component system LytT family sensor kinase
MKDFISSLPKPVTYHLKVFTGSFIAAMIFDFVFSGRLISSNFPVLFSIVFIQVEIAMWMSRFFFDSISTKSLNEFRKAIIIRLILFYIVALIMAVFVILFVLIINSIIHKEDIAEVLSYLVQSEVRTFLLSGATGLLIGAVTFFYFQWQDALNREQNLREEKLIFQYETLKNQVNPHFLFNSLNTLSSLVYKDPKLSDEFIKKLSIIYRYILENSDKESVKLNSEIDFVQNFFYLQEIRDNGKIKLNIDVSNIDDYRILPISLQLLVENALKHNASTRDKPLIINIERENDNIVISNNLQPKQNIENSSKIGLKNLGERIKLMTGKEIEISETNDHFIVKLPLIKV